MLNGPKRAVLRANCRVAADEARGMARGDTGILHCHCLPLLSDLHSNLAVIAAMGEVTILAVSLAC